MWWRSRHITSSTPALEGYADDSLLDSDCWMGWGRHSVIENSDDLPETGRHFGPQAPHEQLPESAERCHTPDVEA